MNHTMHMQNSSAPAPLKEAGNDAFGTIQEVITQLNMDPTTDWSKVNIEALRLHLVDMQDMTINVTVLSQQPVSKGLKAIVKPTTARAMSALHRVFNAHPEQLKRDTGWLMKVREQDGTFILTITTNHPNEVNKIRGLGYIGLMAYGNHHQPHHWAMANGLNPHSQH
ncbi:MAG: hypothetical protein OEL79_06175 [Chromatiales bacterium]|nr:hypothetical protein [Chromatiales bacterium]